MSAISRTASGNLVVGGQTVTEPVEALIERAAAALEMADAGIRAQLRARYAEMIREAVRREDTR